MKKFDLFDFDLTGGMTDREFKDTLGAVSAFCIYEDATGMHNAGVKASASLFYTGGALASKNPTAIIAIGAGVTSFQSCFRGKHSLTMLYSKSWDTSNITSWNYAFHSCAYLKQLTLTEIKSGATTTGTFDYCTRLSGIDCVGTIYPSLSLVDSPLTFASVCNVLDALADTPDEGATITFKSGLYAGFTEAEQAVIDGKVADAVANGWTIVNMGA